MCLFGQSKHLDLGIRENGVCFGNSVKYNGVRLNLVDSNTQIINGLNLSGYSESNHLNGISVGILISGDSVSNGLFIGPLGVMSLNRRDTLMVINGVAAGGGVTAGSMNGGSVAYLLNKFERQKGVSI